jgi:tRNA A-37 threonylcarbamoyl transferase component Bud32/streptogramin lyase
MTIITELAAGTGLASYTIEAVLGRGGMSVVYAAVDHRLGRRVALKVMAPSLSERERFRERFLRESRLAASIDHPNVIPIYEAGEDKSGFLYIAMRLVEGTDLRRLLAAEGKLHPARALWIVGQAASALDAAHARGLLHCDVKPANILIATDEPGREHVYLSDFGLAVPGEGLVGDTSFHGTAEYVAPEQIEGRAEPRSDVYSLACVLYECLTGSPPFHAERLLATLWSQLNDDAPWATTLNPALPEAVDPVLETALAKDPAARPSTCAELVAAARSALGLDRPAGRRLRVLAATSIAATIAALALALPFSLGRDGHAPAVDQATIATLAGTGRSGLTGDGGPAVRAELAEPAQIAVDSAGSVYVAQLSDGHVRRIGVDGRITTVTELQDFGWVGIDVALGRTDVEVGPDGDLYVLDRAAATLRRIDERGVTTTVSGTGRAGVLQDGPVTVSDRLCSGAAGPAFDGRGRIYLACPSAHRVVRLDPDGALTVVAGTGIPRYSGDGGPATEAGLNYPSGIAFNQAGDLYIADFYNNRVRRVDSDGVITTVAGTGQASLSGDGWRATAVDLRSPTEVAVDGEGDLYIVEYGTSRIRKVDPGGVISTVAGTGTPGFSGDGGPAGEARLNQPSDVAVDRAGNVYIADRGNNRVRVVRP